MYNVVLLNNSSDGVYSILVECCTHGVSNVNVLFGTIEVQGVCISLCAGLTLCCGVAYSNAEEG